MALGVAKGRPPEATYRVVSKEALLGRGVAKEGVNKNGVKDVAEIAIARTLENFEFHKGPGLLLIDFDLKFAPVDVRSRITTKGLDAVLAEICPEIATCGRIVRESTSSGLGSMVTCTRPAADRTHTSPWPTPQTSNE